MSFSRIPSAEYFKVFQRSPIAVPELPSTIDVIVTSTRLIAEHVQMIVIVKYSLNQSSTSSCNTLVIDVTLLWTAHACGFAIFSSTQSHVSPFLVPKSLNHCSHVYLNTQRGTWATASAQSSTGSKKLRHLSTPRDFSAYKILLRSF